MARPSPILDHIVIDVRGRINEAAQCFTALGFQLTPRGYHSLGSSNHLAMFAGDYLELLGFGAGGATRPEIEPFPIGLNGLVFKAHDAEPIYQYALVAGLPIQPVESFARPVSLAGEMHDARFRTTRLDPKEVPMGRIYFCEHLTPELVWRTEWQAHPNGARAIARVVVSTPKPQRTAAMFHALFGSAAVAEGGLLIVFAGAARIEPASPATVADEFGEAAADPADRREYLAAVAFRVTSLSETARLLRSTTGLRAERNRVVVPAVTASTRCLQICVLRQWPRDSMLLWAGETERGRQSKEIIGRTPKAQTTAPEGVAAVRPQGCLNVVQANACTNPQTTSLFARRLILVGERREKVRSQNFDLDSIRHYLKPRSEVYPRRKSATRSRTAFAAVPATRALSAHAAGGRPNMGALRWVLQP